jgi:hypothetical protein
MVSSTRLGQARKYKEGNTVRGEQRIKGTKRGTGEQIPTGE